MNMNALKEIISDLVDKEKTSTIKNHGYAHSDHEALALLREEICEAQSEIKLIAIWEVALKQSVHRDECHQYSKLVNKIKQKAINGACELIQVAAMCEKFKESREVREYDESE